MRRTEAERLLGALLGNGTGLRPARRRRAAPRAFGGIPGGSALARTAISVLGGIAIEALRGMNRPSAPAPAPRPAQALPPRPVAQPREGLPWRLPPVAVPEAPAETDAEGAEALLLVRAMIAAARADGQIDQHERKAIAERLDAAELDAAQRDRVVAEFASPISLSALAAEVADPVAAAQVYAASVIAVGEASAAERDYLVGLAAALGLAPETAAAIEARLST